MKKLVSFAVDVGTYALKGGIQYKVWLLFLLFFIVTGSYTAYIQLTEGLITVGASDQIPMELFFANFIFTAHPGCRTRLLLSP